MGFLLINKAGPTIFSGIKSFFKRLKNQYNRYPKRLFFDGGKEINNDFKNWLSLRESILLPLALMYTSKMA